MPNKTNDATLDANAMNFKLNGLPIQDIILNTTYLKLAIERIIDKSVNDETVYA